MLDIPSLMLSHFISGPIRNHLRIFCCILNHYVSKFTSLGFQNWENVTGSSVWNTLIYNISKFCQIFWSITWVNSVKYSDLKIATLFPIIRSTKLFNSVHSQGNMADTLASGLLFSETVPKYSRNSCWTSRVTKQGEHSLLLMHYGYMICSLCFFVVGVDCPAWVWAGHYRAGHFFFMMKNFWLVD